MNNAQGDLGGVLSPQAAGGALTEHIAETTLFTSQSIPTGDCRALEVDLVTRVIGTGSITVAIDRFDKSSQTWINMLTGAAVITNTTNRYRVSPNLTAAANSVAQDHLPEIFRVTVTHNNANAVTYSLSYHLAN